MNDGLTTRYVCPECQHWEIASVDSYCGYCGCKFESYRLYLSPKNFVLGKAARMTVEVELVNLLLRNATIHDISLSENIDAKIIDPPQISYPHVLSANQKLSFKIEVSTSAVSHDEEHRLELTFTTDFQDEPIREIVRIMPSPVWEMRPANSSFTFQLDNLNEAKSLELFLARGYASFNRIKVEPPFISILPAATQPLEKGFILDAKAIDGPASLALSVSVDKTAMEKFYESNPDPTVLASLQVLDGDGLLKDFLFNIKMSIPPRFNIKDAEAISPSGAGEPILFNCPEERIWIGGRLSSITIPLFKINNTGGEKLEINLLPAAQESWLSSISNVRFIDANSEAELRVTIDLLSAPAGRHEIHFIFDTNHYGQQNVKIDCRKIFDIQEMMPLKGFAALDFGTTNSCCVVFDSIESVWRLLPLDWGVEDAFDAAALTVDPIVDDDSRPGLNFQEAGVSIPSLISYKRKRIRPDNQEERVFVIGAAAKLQLKSPEAANSVVSSVKSKLGVDGYMRIAFSEENKSAAEENKLSSVQVASDIIRSLLGRAEYLLGKRIDSCYFSHPVGFVRERIDALTEAIRTARVQIGLENFFPEPVCAAYYLIEEELIRKYNDMPQKSTEETILVYDFGGGTTDICYLKIKSKKMPNDTLKLEPKIIGLDGHRRFGGDTITTEITKVFIDKIRQKYPKCLFYFPLRPYPSTISGRDLRVGQANYKRIWDIAEEAKITLSAGAPKSQFSASLDFPNGKSEIASIEFTQSELEAVVGPKIDSTLGLIKDVLLRAKAMGEKDVPDYILLSGNSSKLPLVKEKFGAMFPPEKIKFPHKPSQRGNGENGLALKECVAIGLYFLARQKTLQHSVWFDRLEKINFSTIDLGFQLPEGGHEKYYSLIKKGQVFGQWVDPEKSLVLQRGKTILIVEQIDLSLHEPVAEYYLSADQLQDWTDEELSCVRLKARLTPDYELELKLVLINEKTKKITKEYILPKERIPVTIF